MTDKAMGAYSDPNSMPPMGQAVPLGLQHVLAMFASNVTSKQPPKQSNTMSCLRLLANLHLKATSCRFDLDSTRSL